MLYSSDVEEAKITMPILAFLTGASSKAGCWEYFLTSSMIH